MSKWETFKISISQVLTYKSFKSLKVKLDTDHSATWPKRKGKVSKNCERYCCHINPFIFNWCHRFPHSFYSTAEMAFSCQFGKYLRYLFATQLKRLKVNESSLNSYHQQSLRITARRNLRWEDHQSNVRPVWASHAILTRKGNFWRFLDWSSAFVQISSVTQSRENDENICYQKWLTWKSSWLRQAKIAAVRLSKIQTGKCSRISQN